MSLHADCDVNCGGTDCHAPRDGRMCAGYIAARAKHVADPLPPEVVALISKWQYSPPDDSGKHS